MVAVKFQRADKADDVVYGHAVAQHAADELGIVPIFGVELLGQSLYGGLVAALVHELEVVSLLSVVTDVLDNAPL